MVEKEYPLLVADKLDSRNDIFTVECLKGLVEDFGKARGGRPIYAFQEFTGQLADLQGEILSLRYDATDKTVYATVKILDTPKGKLVLEWEAMRQKLIQDNHEATVAHAHDMEAYEKADKEAKPAPVAPRLVLEPVPKPYELAAGGRLKEQDTVRAETGERTVNTFELGDCALVTNKVK